MKKNIFLTQAAIAMFYVFCGSAFAQQYWTGDGGKGIRLAVLEPEGKGISENDKWTLSVVQSVIYTDFGKYSDMTIIDRQNLEKVFEEWKESMSGHYSDADRIKIGNLTNASHILSGTVIKTPSAFMLELSVTNLQSGERKASYSQPVSASALENHSAIKGASADLLKQLGVNLTGTALAELKQAANTARIQAEEALARGIVAKKRGTEVAALSYFYQAAALDPTMLEAANRSSVMSANISSGNIGADTRNDILWRRDWVARLTEAEKFFNDLFNKNSLLYTLFYSNKIIPGDIDYETETQTLIINTNLHASGAWVWLSSVEKALQVVYDGLDATKRKKDWGLQDWPWRGVTELRPFESKRKTFSIAAELVNSRGKIIGRANFESSGEWVFNRYGRPEIYISDDDRKQVSFASVKADDITDRITIRIANVNGIDAHAAARTGVLQVKAISEAQWDSYVSFRMGKGGITGYNGKGGELVIPDSIWNEPVTAIGTDVFRYKNITRIAIGRNVEIHENAFDNKFSEFYNKNYNIYGRLRERVAGTYSIDRDNNWDLTVASDVMEKKIEEQEEEEWQEQREQWRTDNRETARAAVWIGLKSVTFGVPIMMNSIDSLYRKVGFLLSLNSEFFKSDFEFIRIGLNFDLGFPGLDKEPIREAYPDAESVVSYSFFAKLGPFLRLYPVNAWYLSGGAAIGYYNTYKAKVPNGDEDIRGPQTLAPVFSVGTGLVFGEILVLEGLYHILPSINSKARYFSITLGFKQSPHW
jgi:hypothetical protein